MSPSKKSQANSSTPKRRGRRPNLPPRSEVPNPRRGLRALAILANAAAAHTAQLPPVNQPIVPPPAPEIMPGDGVNGQQPQDLNIPPPEGVQDPQQGGELQPALAPLMQPIAQHVPAGLGAPFFFALQQAQGVAALPNNFNGGIPSYNIRVRSLNLHDHGIAYTVLATESMYRVYFDYAARVDLGVHQIIIKRFDVVVPSLGTAFAAGIQDGDVLSVEPVIQDHNVDTRFKRFTMQDLSAYPREMKINALPHATLYAAYEMWGAQNNVDPINMIGFHENMVVTGLHTITEAGIKNQDRLYILPNNWREP